MYVQTIAEMEESRVKGDEAAERELYEQLKAKFEPEDSS